MKIKVLPDDQSHGLTMQRNTLQAQKRNSDDFGLRGPLIQTRCQPNRAASIVARVPAPGILHLGYYRNGQG